MGIGRKYTIKGNVNGKNAIVRLSVNESREKRLRHYRLLVQMHCAMPFVKTTPIVRLYLSGRWWKRKEEEGIWQIKKIPLVTLTELNGHLPHGEYIGETMFQDLVGGRYTLTIGLQGTRLGEVILLHVK